MSIHVDGEHRVIVQPIVIANIIGLMARPHSLVSGKTMGSG